MTLLWLSCLWVFASVVVAMLPMRQQYVPGVTLLLMAPVLIWMIFSKFGAIAGVAASVAFISMFGNPLVYIFAKSFGKAPESAE